MTLLSAEGAGVPERVAGADDAASPASWGECAWSSRDLYELVASEPWPATSRRLVRRKPAPASAPKAAASAPVRAPRRRRQTGRLKAVLTMLMLTGAISTFLPGGLASFSAETANPSNGIASGTLTMSNAVNGGTACLSNNSPSNDNVNAACDTMISLTNVAPGVSYPTATAYVTVKNTGSLDASKLWLWAPSVTPTLTAALTNGASVSSLAVTPLRSAVAAGQAVILRSGTNSQTFYASAAAAAGATTIGVTAQNANFSYPSGPGGATVQVVDCYDTKTSSTPPGAPNATVGTNLNFNPTAGNPMCGAVLLYVQEVTGMTAGAPSTQNYCWTGQTYSSGGAGMCVAPISVTLSSAISGTRTTLPVTQLNGNVRSGDVLVVTPSSGSPQTFTASADAYVGATSISIASAAVAGTLGSGSTVSHSSSDATGALARLNADTTNTLTNFDTLHDGTRGPIQMPPPSSNGTLGANTLTQLPHDTSRLFLVGVYMPAPTGGNQNPLQGLASRFGLTWHVDQ